MAPPAVKSRSVVWLIAIITLLYTLVLMWMTHAPTVRAPTLGTHGMSTEKLMHFGGYAVLSFLTTTLVRMWRPQGHYLFATILALTIVAGLDELTQPLTLRNAEWLDWFADIAGVIAGAKVGTKIT